MSLTIDCGEGRHQVCSGVGTEVYLVPQMSGERFACGCLCHHGGSGVPCGECNALITPEEGRCARSDP